MLEVTRLLRSRLSALITGVFRGAAGHLGRGKVSSPPGVAGSSSSNRHGRLSRSLMPVLLVVSSLGGALLAASPASAQPPLNQPAAPTLAEVSATSLSVTFTPDTLAASSTVKVYDVSGPTPVQTIPSATSGLTVPSLTTGDSYYATVTSVGDGVTYTDSSEGLASSNLTLVASTQLAQPAVPTIAEVSATSLSVTFTPDPLATSSTVNVYDVSGPTLVDTILTATSGLTVSLLTTGDSYYATVTSVGDGIIRTTSPEGLASSNLTLVASGANTIDITGTKPTDAVVGVGSYAPTATDLALSPVTITVDSSSSTVCSISDGNVTWATPGSCEIDYASAPAGGYTASTMSETFAVYASGGANTIDITGTKPTDAVVGVGSYAPTATDLALSPVTITVDSSKQHRLFHQRRQRDLGHAGQL